MLFLKVILLFVYLVMLIAIYRVVDLVTWSNCDYSGNPISLSLRQLRWVLNSRGINFPLGVEKREVATLINKTGLVTLEELILAEKVNFDASVSVDKYASVSVDNVEDFKDILRSDEAWLIQVRPGVNGVSGVVSGQEWGRVRRKVGVCGVRTAEVDCKESPDICDMYTFLPPLLLVTSQKHSKLDFISRPTDSNRVLSWLGSNMKREIPQLTPEMLERDWLEPRNRRPLQVVFVTPLNSLPLVLKQLQPLCRLAWMDRSSFMTSQLMTSQNTPETPFFLIITPELVVTHERTLHYPQLNLLLKSLNPDVNSLFTASVYFCNAMALLSFVTSQGHALSRSCTVLTSMLFYNAVMLGSWLLCSSSRFILIRERLPALVRRIAMTTAADDARSYLLRTSEHPYYVTIGFFAFFYAAFESLRRRGWVEGEGDGGFPDILSDPDQPMNLSQRFVQRLATPALWLKPLVPLDYIGELAIWEYKSRDRSQSFNREMTSQSCDVALRQRKRSYDSNVAVVRRNRSCDSNVAGGVTRGLINKIQSCFRGRSPKCRRINGPPDGMREEDTCSVCLDKYVAHVTVCGLPCGHVFHHECILAWLQSDQHCCPICRWPAFQRK